MFAFFFSGGFKHAMHSRFLYLLLVAALGATPALAADDATASTNATSAAAPVSKLKEIDNQMPEAPPEESRIQIPDTPHQLHPQPDAKGADKEKKQDMPKETEAAKPGPAAEAASAPVAAIPSLVVSLTPAPAIEKGKEATFMMGLSDEKKNNLSDKDLDDKADGKVTLLAIDESLTDYQRLQPTAVGDKWGFSFKPNTAHNYLLWLDVKPKDKPEQIMSVPMKGAKPCKDNCFDRTVSLDATFGKNKAMLGFDKPLAAGTKATLMLALTDAKGKSLDNLEPVAGSYAYVAAFMADGSQMLRVTPEGARPGKDSKPGNSPLSFTMEAGKPGIVKFFAELRPGGKNVLLPFTAQIADAPAPK